MWVYPRVCGGTPQSGTSSRRSIPACAGEPVVGHGNPRMDEVYPRVCGGTRCRRRYRLPSAGLSPRVRGNHLVRRQVRPQGRSIPACAGEPSRWPSSRRSPSVYPRVCGGTALRSMTNALQGGLSPRVRGNPARRALPAAPDGSIPACAGEPSSDSGREEETGVYPRVCGGTCKSYPFLIPLGLSPRVRGNPTRRAGSNSV